MYDDIAPLWFDDRLDLGRPFTTSQARERGITADKLRALHREGLVRRVFRGVYVDAATDDNLLTRAQALALVVPPTAVVTDECAAWVRGIDLVARGDQVIPPPLTIFQPLDRTRVRRPGTAGGRRTLLPHDVEVVNGLLVTTCLRTACDLARLRSRERGLAGLDALMRHGGFSHAALHEEEPRYRGYRGAPRLRELAPLTDADAESPAESVMRLRWIDARLPSVTTQIPILNDAGSEIYRLDLGVPELRYAAEYDGVAWHSSPEQRDRDRRRRAWLATRGWVIDVLGYDEVFGSPGRAAAIFRSGLTRAERRTRGAS
jgi:hypothetical protein